MGQVIHRSNTRGHHNYGWLDTRHTFSFAQYFDPQRTGFGALRVLNDDVVKPNMGFGEHPHDNMEIISIPIKGTLKHKDSAGHEQIIKEHEVQVMSAGTGVFHSEYNASKDEDVNFLQIWIYPDKKNVSPSYNQKYFEAEDAQDKWQLLVGPNGEDGLHINQNATISRA
ncbi:MAG: pirin family protein, partial [Bacteroidota bacterium]